jgi:nicotinamide-nucleotide amidase
MVNADDQLREAAQRAVRRLDQVGWSIAIADSVTSGLLASLTERAPRGRRCFVGGVVSHPHPNQGWLVGVDWPDAIDESSAQSMAVKIQWMFDADVGVGVVGGGQPRSGSREPRSVYVGWAGPDGHGVEHLDHAAVGNDARRACLAVFELVARSTTS